MFADLLQLELRRADPALLGALHGAAAGWFAGHGHPVEAIRHAQAARDWGLAVRLLADHWLGLVLNRRGGTAREFLSQDPQAGLAADPELAALRAYDELDRGSLQEARRYLALAGQGAPSVQQARAAGGDAGRAAAAAGPARRRPAGHRGPAAAGRTGRPGRAGRTCARWR